jgi:acyl dehydratase
MELDALEARVGEAFAPSKWVEISQKRIDRFADVTEDWQFIHLDPERAAQTPFGGTVAHGYLTLSMLSTMAYDAIPRIEGARASVNYGFDRIRFLAPVRAGRRVRAHFTLQAVERRGDDRVLLRIGVEVEIEGEAKPALSADWLTMHLM